MRKNNSKKAIGPVVATALLLVVAVTAVIGFQTWFQGYSSSMFTQSETQSSDLTTGVERVVGDKVYFKTGAQSTNITSIKVNDIECDTPTLSNTTLTEIDISSCLSSSSPGELAEVVIVTPQKIYSETFLVKNTNSTSTNFLSYNYTSTFISTWNTSASGSSSNTEVDLPLESDGTYNFIVSGPTLIGSPITITSHTDNRLNFTSAGVHTINITGTIIGWNFDPGSSGFPDYIPNSDVQKIIGISQWGPLRLGNNSGYFMHASNLNISATDSLDLTGTTSLNSMFRMPTVADNFHYSGTLNWDTSEIQDMTLLFYHTDHFNADISSWDVSNVENFYDTFNNAESFNQDISSWNLQSARFLSGMFKMATSFNQPLNSWDLSNVESIEQMFFGAASFNQPLNNWDVSNTKSFEYLFYNSGFNQNINSWDTTNVENFTCAFCYNEVFNQPLNNWNLSSAQRLNDMFEGSQSFNQDLNSWDISTVWTLEQTFNGATNFNGNISSWNTSNVLDMGLLFSGTNFNQDISSWDVSNVTQMNGMFADTPNFNQDISSWNTTRVALMNAMFRNASSFNQNLSSWDTSNITMCGSFADDTPQWTLPKPTFSIIC